MSAVPPFILVTLGLFAAVVIGVFAIWLLVKCFAVLGMVARHIGRFVIGMFSDFFRTIGAVVLLFILAPLTVLNVVLGRWSASAHYGRAFKNEVKTASVSVYRLIVGHPLRFLGLGGVTEGLEKRLPRVIAEAPGADKPARRVGMFEGYTIIGSLPGGGSGSKLFIAEPNEIKRAAFERQGFGAIDQVVIKSFRLDDGSSLPQIVRESRALDAAKKLGLVFEHELTNDRFFYVMRYVPGESLATLTTRMHGLSPAQGLSDHHLRTTLSYTTDLLTSLAAYHDGGLWHKDVKPDNIIVDGKQAHLVDFGLVTPLRSAMTLTTHGTEYFRDPELVRQALRGVKVHQIDGTRFDVYAAGAVLYSIIENSFPAHGGLSQITKRCPEAVRWIVRRAMADYDKRYASAHEMLADVNAVLAAVDPFAVRPIDLPSMSQRPVDLPHAPVDVVAHAASPVPPPVPHAAPAGGASVPESPARPVPKRLLGRPSLAVTSWWTGKYNLAGHGGAKHPVKYPADDILASVPAGVYLGGLVAGGRTPRPAPHLPIPHARSLRPKSERASAADQLREARGRAAARRRSAQARVTSRRGGHGKTPDPTGINAGIVGSIFIVLLVAAVGLGALLILVPTSSRVKIMQEGGIAHGQVDQAPAPSLPNPVPSSIKTISYDSLGGQRILVISDLKHPLPSSLSDALYSATLTMTDAGATLLGDGPVLRRDMDAVTDEHITLVAELKSRRGQLPHDSNELFNVVRSFVAERHDIDLVIWLSPPTNSRIGVDANIFSSRSNEGYYFGDDIGQSLLGVTTIMAGEVKASRNAAKP
ncbi:MAG: hypothetical protein KF757_08645 [Phycisphaeraceae bacterium]|nr:hypothetical protein [Phycisphaeraceae bacterium]MCW5762822.1 hypothetical protein [Phycisphaeraceae bacterium]